MMDNEGQQQEASDASRPSPPAPTTDEQANGENRTETRKEFHNVYITPVNKPLTEKQGPGTLTLTPEEAIWHSTEESKQGEITWRVRFSEVNLHAIGTNNGTRCTDDVGKPSGGGEQAGTTEEECDGEGDGNSERDDGDVNGNGESFMLVQIGDGCDEVRLLAEDESSVWQMYSAFCECVASCPDDGSDSCDEGMRQGVLSGLDALIESAVDMPGFDDQDDDEDQEHDGDGSEGHDAIMRFASVTGQIS